MQLRLHIQQEVHHHGSIQSPTSESAFAPMMHFIETAPSILREMPWIKLKEFKVNNYYCAQLFNNTSLNYQLLAGVVIARNIFLCI